MRLLVLLLLFPGTLPAAPRQVDAYRWEDVERIVAIGDIHGDYDAYIGVLQAAGLVDARGRWQAGTTHLVQTGDIPDRGPDTRRIIEHMAALAKQAQKRGGRVHNLMGNHEAMNVYGDLRYAVAGEFSAWADQRSAERRERHYAAAMDDLKQRDPQRFAALPADFRTQWDAAHPLGWIEHRMAWDPRFDSRGPMFRWVMDAEVSIQLNDAIFVHGGISHAYCGNSLESLTAMAHAQLREGDDGELGILTDSAGPLWYRGLAGVAPAAPRATVDAILERHGARHIVIGHTVSESVVWPRLDARVIQIDTGMSRAYGGAAGWLEIQGNQLSAGYRGGRVPLPADDAGRLAYLDAVIALQPANAALAERRAALAAGALDAAQAQADAAAADPAAICSTSR
ncbi:MAG: metallophosphoesterase [Rhodanobacteraceae bacterium]|nr:metallophosphoesterase [Rhodanobacteraceae bacterium]